MDLEQSKIKNRVVFVLPTYNEELNIQSTIQQIFEQPISIEQYVCNVLVVDDNSPDRTQAVVHNLMEQNENVYLLTGPKTGLGNAYKRGFKFAIENLKADIIFQMDSDGQHDASLVPIFINMLEDGNDVIIGSRFIEGGALQNFSLFRRVLSKVGNFLVRYIGGVKNIRDCTSGYRAIKASNLEDIDFSFLSTRGYSFQSSLICDLIWRGAKVKEIPIIFKERNKGNSKLSFHDQLEFLINIPKLGFRNFKDFLKYSLVGLSGVFLNFGIYSILTRYFNLSEISAPLISIEISLISNFILHNLWTFNNRPKSNILISRLVRFHIASALGGSINYLTFLFLLLVLGLYDLLAYLIGIGFAAVINYLVNSNWTWK